MGLGNAKGGDFLKADEWLALGKDQALLIARPTAYRESTSTINGKALKGEVHPVDADVVFVTGDRANEVLRGANLIGAGMTGPLRRNGLNEDMAARCQLGKNGGTTYVQFNPASPTEFETIKAYYAAAAEAGFTDDPYTYAEKTFAVGSMADGDDDDPPF